LYAMGAPEREPVRPGGPHGWHIAGLYAAVGTLQALWHRGAGSGGKVAGSGEGLWPSAVRPTSTAGTDAADKVTPLPSPRYPLPRLKVLDLSMGWAGPFAGQLFSDMGAEVIKVESCSHPDWWRGQYYGMPADSRLWE